jgi:hypothetical protein
MDVFYLGKIFMRKLLNENKNPHSKHLSLIGENGVKNMEYNLQ